MRAGRSLLRDAALDQVRGAVVVGDLPAGGATRDVDLADRLGLSVAPVRTALARLVEEGLRFARARAAASTTLHGRLVDACQARDVPTTTAIRTAPLSELEENL